MRGIKVRAIIDSGTVVASLASRILGRTTAEDVRDPATNELVVPNATLLEEQHVERLDVYKRQEIRRMTLVPTVAMDCGPLESRLDRLGTSNGGQVSLQDTCPCGSGVMV